MNRKSKGFGMNVGTSSILLIFVTLCLVSFATLSLVSANADRKLSTKVADRTVAYYNACNKAEESIAGIDATLRQVYSQVENKDEYFAQVGYSKTYAIPISELQTLNVHLSILYPENSSGSFYEINTWKIITTGALDYDDKLPVITE